MDTSEDSGSDTKRSKPLNLADSIREIGLELGHDRKVKEEEIAIRKEEIAMKKREENLTSLAADLLEKEYPNLEMEDLVKSINLLSDKGKAATFLRLQAKVRDAWLKDSISSIHSVVSISSI